jgi:hypothetical protein
VFFNDLRATLDLMCPESTGVVKGKFPVDQLFVHIGLLMVGG